MVKNNKQGENKKIYEETTSTINQILPESNTREKDPYQFDMKIATGENVISFWQTKGKKLN